MNLTFLYLSLNLSFNNKHDSEQLWESLDFDSREFVFFLYSTIRDKFSCTYWWFILTKIQRLLSCFRRFLARDSSTDQQKLLQLLDNSSSALKTSFYSCSLLSSQYLIEQRLTVSKTRSHSTRKFTSSRTLSNSFLSSFEDIALSYFTNEIKINDATRVQLLIETARDFVQKLIVSRSSYEQLWLIKLHIFEQSKIENISRTRRLHESRRKIEQGSKEYECIDRFALLFLRHDIDEIIASLKNTTLSQKRSKTTVAYERITLDFFTTVEALTRNKMNSWHFLSLLKKSDSDDLLKLDDSVSNLWACNT